MILVIAVDDRNGMMFNGRRQSQDSAARDYLLRLVKKQGGTLWMNQYSAGQFQEDKSIVVDDQFLSKAGMAGFCFVEDYRAVTEQVLASVIQIVIIRWNRKYPGDVYFDPSVLNKMHRVRTVEFPGTSHEKITVEMYSI